LIEESDTDEALPLGYHDDYWWEKYDRPEQLGGPNPESEPA
jgi:hypothetical protein